MIVRMTSRLILVPRPPDDEPAVPQSSPRGASPSVVCALAGRSGFAVRCPAGGSHWPRTSSPSTPRTRSRPRRSSAWRSRSVRTAAARSPRTRSRSAATGSCLPCCRATRCRRPLPARPFQGARRAAAQGHQEARPFHRPGGRGAVGRPVLDTQRQSPASRPREAQGGDGPGDRHPGGPGRLPDPGANTEKAHNLKRSRSRSSACIAG